MRNGCNERANVVILTDSQNLSDRNCLNECYEAEGSPGSQQLANSTKTRTLSVPCETNTQRLSK